MLGQMNPNISAENVHCGLEKIDETGNKLKKNGTILSKGYTK